MFRSALLYAALLLGANAALAENALEALKTGEMKRLMLLEAPVAASAAQFVDAQGAAHSLTEYRGKVVLANFWAISCAPCRKEMPALNALETEMGGADFAVVPIAIGYNNLAAIDRFFTKQQIDALPLLFDKDRVVASEMGVGYPPVTVLIDRAGNEVGRLIGEADWNSPEARAMIQALIER
ncbi:MAG: thioredoxin [Rhodobacterales bacterium]|nr:MAG: thioredoxin [Rhodobacterales bacterium]